MNLDPTNKKLTENLVRVLRNPESIKSFLDENVFLDIYELLYGLTVNDLRYVEVTADHVLNNFNISFIGRFNEKFIFYRLPDVSLLGNLDLFNFIAHTLETQQELNGIIFKKNNYFVPMTKSITGWVLEKFSGRVRVNNWAEGCAIAYEMGMAVHILYYVRNSLSLSEPENIKEIQNVMKEISNLYKDAPSIHNLQSLENKLPLSNSRPRS